MPGTSRKAARAARMARFLELKLFFMFVSSLFFSCIWRFRVPPSLRDAQIRKKRDQKSPVRCIIHGMLRLLPRWLCLAAICAAPVVAGTICVTDTLAHYEGALCFTGGKPVELREKLIGLWQI